MSGIFFPLSRCDAVGAYTSSQFLSANRFQGEHRWAQLRATMWRTPRCQGLYESAARRCRCAFDRARPGGPVSGMQTKESCIKGEKAQRCNWNPLGLHNVRWPSSSKQELKEPTPCPLLCLIPRALCGWKRLNGVGSEQMLKSQGFAQPPNRART